MQTQSELPSNRPATLPELPRGLDLFSSYGAGRLAKHIEDYWRARGFAGVRAERFEVGVGEAWGVRSNLVNGYPPRSAMQEAA